jgi:formylmethanofuran dehydrogenase subunit E
MNDFDFYCKKVGDYHGHVCGGIALGTKMTLAAMQALGIKPGIRNKNLVVYVEVDRCMTDAVQVITGCSLGHRSLKHVDYGKFAATFVNLETGKALRATVKEEFDSNKYTIEELSRILSKMPNEDLVILQDVKVDIPENDLPGSPREKALCSRCGERVMDGREVKRSGTVLCRACAGTKYYQEV